MTKLNLLTTGLLAACLAAGCTSIRGFSANAPQRAPAAKDAEIERFVQSWNHNAGKIRSVRCDGVDISGKAEGKPIPLTAKIGYSQPSNFRMTGSSIGGKSEVDLGSNQDEIWFWVARDPNQAVYFCKRDDFQNVNIAMPFHPDWIADLLGVTAIDESRFKPGSTTPEYFTLVANETTPTGHEVIRRLVISRESGRLAAIELFDPNNLARPMVDAIIERYYEDASSGLFLPSRIHMSWPESKTKLTITMPHRHIMVNPNIPSVVFQRNAEDYVNVQMVDLGRMHQRSSAVPVRGPDSPTGAPRGYDPRLQRAAGTRLRGVIEAD